MIVNGRERSDKIVVLLGGNSPERKISLDSGRNVIDGLRDLGFDVVAIDPIEPSWQQQLAVTNPCYIFIILHGPNGEDGKMQGYLDSCGFSYSGSGVLGSALAMDKGKAKDIWLSNNLPTLPFATVNDMSDDTIKELIATFSLPICLKVVDGGSSIGIEKVTREDDMRQAFSNLSEFKSNIICESWIENIKEYTVGILGKKPLPVIKIVPSLDYYDFEAKYNSKETQYLCPSDLSEDEEMYLQEIAIKAFELLGCSHFGRIDFIKDSHGKFYLLEANTIPGFTKKSLVPMAANAVGISFTDLLLFLLPAEVKKLAAVSMV